MLIDDKSVLELIKLGLSEYQAKVYTALASIGPSGVTEISNQSKVPRTKTYETLRDLSIKGIVDFQPGRPVIYRAISPEALTKSMVENYTESARNVLTSLQEKMSHEHDTRENLAWVVRGDKLLRKKLSELISSAQVSITLLETYPPFDIKSVATNLRSAIARGIKVKAICIIPGNFLEEPILEDKDMIVYRRMPDFSHTGNQNGTNEGRLDNFRTALELMVPTMSSPYGSAIIDKKVAYIMLRDPNNSALSYALSARIPGVPAMMEFMFEEIFRAGRKINANKGRL